MTLTVNFSNFSSLLNLIWLIWLSLRYHDHQKSIVKIYDHLWGRNDGNGIEFVVLDHNSDSDFDSLVIIDLTNKTRPSNLFDVDEMRNDISVSSIEGDISFVDKDQDQDMSDFFIIAKSRKNNGVTTEHSKAKTTHSSRRISQSPETIETKCFLTKYDNSTTTQTFGHEIIPYASRTFKLNFNFKTNKFPKQTTWNLSPLEYENQYIIDSISDGSVQKLLPETLNSFEYFCYVLSKGDDDLVSNNKICYTFEMNDSGSEGDGICCGPGNGYYTLKLNDNLILQEYERFYSFTTDTTFCLDDGHVGEEEKEYSDDNVKLYPSRECLHKKCLCDSNPRLSSSNDDIDSHYPGLGVLKREVMMNIRSLTDPEHLKNFTSPQYKAACWVLNDDPYLNEYFSTEGPTLTRRMDDAENRMLQRYILAVIYFATTGENWTRTMDFLSAKSECEWHEENFRGAFTLGSQCDENNHIMSLIFSRTNMDGPIVHELFGLDFLQQLAFVVEEKLEGSIPESLGSLSELRYLRINGCPKITGTIPQELFYPKRIEILKIFDTNITGSIPSFIGNLQRLQGLELNGNSLTGAIPNELYSLTDLRRIYLHENELSSTISPLIGNLNNLRRIRLFDNYFTSSLPSELGTLVLLEELILNRNKFSGSIPPNLKELKNIEVIKLYENELKGEVPYELCEIEPLPSITADCRNDIFQAEVSCSCCSYCADKTPTWNGLCPDSKLRFEIEHVQSGIFFSSEGLEWSIIDTATNQKLLGGGPYMEGSTLETSYETCVALSSCFSLEMKSEPLMEIRTNANFAAKDFFKTNFYVYLNDQLVHEDVYEADFYNKTVLPEVTFQYDDLSGKTYKGFQCARKEITCDDKLIQLNLHQRIMYNQAVKISGTSKFAHPSTPQSNAFCWILGDGVSTLSKLINNNNYEALEMRFTQRYVLTLLHLTSSNPLFGDDIFPPLSHECEWGKGIDCLHGETLTILNLSSTKNQISNTLISEVGSLAFLRGLYMQETGLNGTIPQTYSNLYSLIEIDLSNNSLTGTIPMALFDQLDRLNTINFSNNYLSGDIPTGLGKYSKYLSTIKLGQNRLRGLLPLDSFYGFNLWHLDVSNNLLSGSISPLLLKHEKMEYLNLSQNFFVGSLEEELFMKLSQLKFFDVSNNELTGIIPSLSENSSKITYFDMHSNRITGILPVELLNSLVNLEHLNLQGNEIRGSLPDELNKLEKLHTLVLSHNELSGTIPLQLKDKLVHMERLYLHDNKLYGKAPESHEKIKHYITDCGYPAVSLEPVFCSDCNICCNADDLCQTRSRSTMQPTLVAVVFTVCLCVSFVLVYELKNKITEATSENEIFGAEKIMMWSASELIGEKTMYHYFLTPNKTGWWLAFGTACAQLTTLFLFISAADTSHEESDVQYTMICSEFSLECEEGKSQDSFGYLVFALVLTAWLLKDIVGSFKLFVLAVFKKNIDFFFAAIVIFIVTAFSAWTSIYYNNAFSTKNTELIANAVILLFVNELDERLYQLVEACNSEWIKEVEECSNRSSYHEKKELILHRVIHKTKKRSRRFFSKLKGNSLDIDPDIVIGESQQAQVELEGFENNNFQFQRSHQNNVRLSLWNQNIESDDIDDESKELNNVPIQKDESKANNKRKSHKNNIWFSLWNKNNESDNGDESKELNDVKIQEMDKQE